MDSRRDWPARTIAALALILGARYLVWRVDSTMSGVWLPLTLALFAGELYALLSLAGFTFTTWRLRPVDRISPVRQPAVDVYVPTYDEDEQVLRSTLIGCAALDYPNFEIWVLDDGRRPWVADLAADLGARYLTREQNVHAKAGNINAALPRTRGELILILDADHVPQPQMLQAVVGHFEDDGLAYVQTPHEFYNRDSVQHVEHDDHDQSMFFHVVQPGRDDHGAAFWCGSGAVIRRAALEEVGGLATDTITEDFHTSLRIHRRGWRSRFHDEALVYGIAPHNLEQFLLQRHRWAAGNLATLRTADSPLRASRLTWRQRVCYGVGLAEVLTSLQRALLIVVLAVTVGWGRLPIHASAGQFLAEFVPWAVASTHGVADAVVRPAEAPDRGSVRVLHAPGPPPRRARARLAGRPVQGDAQDRSRRRRALVASAERPARGARRRASAARSSGAAAFRPALSRAAILRFPCSPSSRRPRSSSSPA